MKYLPIVIATCLVLSACKGQDPEAAAKAAAAQKAAQEQAAEVMEKQFNDAVAAHNWRLAKGYGDVLQVDHPTTDAAARVKDQLDDVRAKADADAQQQRLAALWDYGDELVKPNGHVIFSTINRNPKSYLFAIVGVEYVLRMLPKGTHDYRKFIRPSELDAWARSLACRRSLCAADGWVVAALAILPAAWSTRFCPV